MPATARGTRPSRIEEGGSLRILVIGRAEQDEGPHAGLRDLARLENDFIDRELRHPRHGWMTGCRTFVPGTMNIGYTKSETSSSVSRTMARQLSLWRRRRGLAVGKPIVMLSSE